MGFLKVFESYFVKFRVIGEVGRNCGSVLLLLFGGVLLVYVEDIIFIRGELIFIIVLGFCFVFKYFIVFIRVFSIVSF